MNKYLSDIEDFLDSGLLLFAIFVSSSLCSLLLILTNKRKSFFFWLLRWVFVMFLLPHRYFESILDQNIPFESPIESPKLFVFITLFFLFFDLMTGNSNRMKKTNKFKKVAKLIPLEQAVEEESVDGTSRQVTKEIISNEHELLDELIGNLGSSNSGELEEGYGEKLSKMDEKLPLANQNFPEIEGKIDVAESNQEYCGSCNEPVKEEWKACPYCGEFLDEYE